MIEVEDAVMEDVLYYLAKCDDLLICSGVREVIEHLQKKVKAANAARYPFVSEIKTYAPGTAPAWVTSDPIP